MYEQYFGFKVKPFSMQPDPAFLYLGPMHENACMVLEYAIANQAGYTVVTGEIGSGKTTLIRYLISMINKDTNVGVLTNTNARYGTMLQWVLLALDQPFSGKENIELYSELRRHIQDEYRQGRKTLLIVDEAQNMDIDTLEELRLLTNINVDSEQMIQLILMGQPELRDVLKEPALKQFAQRIAVDYHIGPLDLAGVAAYIKHRLKVAGGDPNLFDANAVGAIAYHTMGLPRVINNICDLCLVYAYAECTSKVTAGIVTQVFEDREKGGILPSRYSAEEVHAMDTISRAK